MGFELFADRFQNAKRLWDDPAFTLWTAEDLERSREVCVQALWSPALREDVGLARQLNAVQAFEEARQREVSEWIAYGGQALWVRECVSGRRLADVAETQRDEVYLQWLKEALEVLAVHHDAGLWHLAQGRASWVWVPDGAGDERLALADFALFPELPLGMRVHPENLAALAPEFFREAPLDQRADLYALACLILRQRSPKAFERVQGIGPWLDLHLGERVWALVPKTASPLNELLRRMLQPDPASRPADARAALAEIPGAGLPAATPPPIADWIYERALRRRATLFFRCVFDLSRAGDPRAVELLETGPAHLREVYPAWHAYLRVEAARRAGDEGRAREIFSEVERFLEAKPDPRLRALAALAELRLRAQAVDAAGRAASLGRAEAALAGNLDPELEAELHFEKASVALERLAEAEAFRESAAAWRLLRDVEGAPLREPAGLRLADLAGSHGRAEEAMGILRVLLAAREPADPAGLEVAAALTALRLGRFEEAKELFYRAKSRISAQKDLRRLIWAAAQELRLFLAQGDLAQAGRELRVLKVRARGQEGGTQILAAIELAESLARAPQTPPAAADEWEGALTAWTKGEAPFRDLLWPPAESCELLARAARLWGRESEAAALEARAVSLRPDLSGEIFATPPVARPEPTPEVSPIPPEVPRATAPEVAGGSGPGETATAETPRERGASDEEERLRAENRNLRERVRRLERELSQLRAGDLPMGEAPPEKSETELADLAAAREALERRSIVAALRKHLGNRIEAARELKIHRRTLFEKIRRYGLTEADFMPSPQEIESTLAECRGNKSRAAERLGMSRSSFYRWWKQLRT